MARLTPHTRSRTRDTLHRERFHLRGPSVPQRKVDGKARNASWGAYYIASDKKHWSFFHTMAERQEQNIKWSIAH